MDSDHSLPTLVGTSSIGIYTLKGIPKEVSHGRMENYLAGIIQPVLVARIHAEPICIGECVILATLISTSKPGDNMRDYLEIGPVPANEECQQVGTGSYDPIAAREECRRFIEAIRKVLGDEPEGARLKITSNPHDFGSYYEVVCWYDDNLPESVDYAFKVESDSPTEWPEGV